MSKINKNPIIFSSTRAKPDIDPMQVLEWSNGTIFLNKASVSMRLEFNMMSFYTKGKNILFPKLKKAISTQVYLWDNAYLEFQI